MKNNKFFFFFFCFRFFCFLSLPTTKLQWNVNFSFAKIGCFCMVNVYLQLHFVDEEWKELFFFQRKTTIIWLIVFSCFLLLFFCFSPSNKKSWEEHREMVEWENDERKKKKWIHFQLFACWKRESFGEHFCTVINFTAAFSFKCFFTFRFCYNFALKLSEMECKRRRRRRIFDFHH